MKWRNHEGKRSLRWVLAVIFRCLLAVMPLAANGQSSATPLADFQSWDEVDVSARAARILDIAWVTQGRFSSGYPNPAAYLSGLDFKLSAGSHFELTPSYYYAAFETTSGKKGHFQVPMFAVTVRDTGKNWTVSDRNRFLGAIGSATDFWIYRNRPRMDYNLSAKLGATVFVWDEVSYFSVFHRWSRNRFAAGLRKTFNEKWAAEIYYLRQDDSVVQPRDMNALGLTLSFRIR